jgi:hypothetical protein
MEKTPTAEEFLKQYQDDLLLGRIVLHKAMIEFTKLHVEAALKAAMYKADEKEMSSMEVNEYYREKILNSYSLENIK